MIDKDNVNTPKLSSLSATKMVKYMHQRTVSRIVETYLSHNGLACTIRSLTYLELQCRDCM